MFEPNVDYNQQKNFGGSSAAISTISGSESQSVHLGKKKKTTKKTHKKQVVEEPGVCDDVLGIIRKLWATRQTEIIDKEKNPDLYVKITLRELIVFLVFLLLLCLITFCMTSPLVFHFTSVLSNQFTTGATSEGLSFQTIGGIDDVWKYLEGPFMDALYTNWYGDANTTEITSSYILNENRLLGVPRLRQLKIKNNSCVVHDDFKEEIKACYDSYSEFLEDKEPFGKFITQNETNDTAWFYQTEKELRGSTVDSLINSYQGGGFVKTLSKDKYTTMAIIDDLKSNLWITRGTRVVFVDLTIYNANINQFCQIRLTFEFPATGGVITSSTFRTSKLIRYVSSIDYFVMACEILFAVYIFYYTIEELIEIYTQGTSYFKGFWNIVDIVIILVSYVCIAFNVYRQFKVEEILENLLKNEEQFQDFEFLCYWQLQFNNIIAGTVFIAWMKIFKYTSFNKTMTQLTETLARCARDVAGFAVMFFIIFFAYAQLGYLIFGTQVNDFSTFSSSVFTLFRIILGDFDYESIERAQRLLGPLFFLTYVFFVFFVLLNMFLAIINDTYGEVKAEIVESEIKLTSFLKKGYNKILEKYNIKRDRIIDIQKALSAADLNNDKQVDFDELRNVLKAKGYSDIEIETLFSKYDDDGDRTLNQKEQLKMYEDLAKEDEELKEKLKNLKNNLNEEEEKPERINKRSQGVPFEDYNSLSERIDRMESSLDGIVTKIDSVLVKLGSNEGVHNEPENDSDDDY